MHIKESTMWNKPEDSLPEKDKNILCYRYANSQEEYKYGQMMSCKRIASSHTFCQDNNHWYPFKPEYWMYIPNIPGKECIKCVCQG